MLFRSLDRSFLVYPVWSWLWPFGGNRTPDLMNRVQTLYPRFDNDNARAFIQQLNLDAPAALLELDRRQAEFRFMDIELTRWSDTPRPIDAHQTDPLGMHLGQRRHIANQLRRAWRRDESTLHYVAGLFDVHSLTLRLDDNDLPTDAFGTGFTGFEHIEHLSIAGNTFPAAGHAFLALFPNVRALHIDCELTELPAAITDMTQLTDLNLQFNRLRLTEASAGRLANMVNLRSLNLNGNPLGITPDLTRMVQLTSVRLRGTDLHEWPIGAAEHGNLNTLYLQENQISSIPEQVFTHIRARLRNRRIYLHDNPLSAQALERLEQYRTESGIVMARAVPGITHAPATERHVTPWLRALDSAQHAPAKQLWDALSSQEEIGRAHV